MRAIVTLPRLRKVLNSRPISTSFAFASLLCKPHAILTDVVRLLFPPQASDGSAQLTMREEMETNLIRSLIQSYFAIVRQTI